MDKVLCGKNFLFIMFTMNVRRIDESCSFWIVSELGDKVLLGPQNIARIISIPEADIALVQMDVVPGKNARQS